VKQILLILIFFFSVNTSIGQIHVNPGVDKSSQQVQLAISFMEENINAFIKENPEVKIDNSQSFYYLDSQTNPQYAIQGLLCHLAYEKGGVEELKKLMNYKNIERIYTDYFRENEEKVNEFLKEEIKKYCQ